MKWSTSSTLSKKRKTWQKLQLLSNSLCSNTCPDFRTELRLQAASVVPSTGIHAFQTCPQVPLAPTQAGQFPQFHPLPTMVQGGTQPEQTFPSSAHLVPSNPIQVTQLDATDGNVLPSSQDVSALPSDEQSLRRERSRTPKKKPRSRWWGRGALAGCFGCFGFLACRMWTRRAAQGMLWKGHNEAQSSNSTDYGVL